MRKIELAEVYFNQDNTPVSTQFDDVYFSNQDGLAESHYVFMEGNQLWQRWQASTERHFVIAETGFGTGLNFLAVTTLFRQFRQQFPQSPLKRLFFISFEKYPLPLKSLRQAHQQYPQFQVLSESLQTHWQPYIEGCQRIHFAETTLDIWFGDVAEQLIQLGDYMHNRIDAWFLDGFAPSKNPQMWTEQLYQAMYDYSKCNGTFATFTAASAVRKGLENVGFQVEKRKGYGKKRECLWGVKKESAVPKLNYAWYLPQPAQLCEQVDVAIIGGGIASLFTALCLMERCAKVTLYCEDEQLAQNASGNKQGAFYPQLSDDDSKNIRFYVHAFTYGLQRLHWAISQDIEFEKDFCGVALCGYDHKSAVKLGNISALQWHPNLYQPLSAKELSERIGLPVRCDGAFIAQGGWLAPQQFVQNAFAFLQRKGLIIKTSQKITALSQRQSSPHPSWCLKNSQGEAFEHSVVVLANGHQLTEFEQTQCLPLYAVRGQVSEIATSTQLQQLKSVVCYDGYLTPMAASGTHCIGASHVRDCADRSFSLLEQQQNHQKIQRNLADVEWVKDIDTSANQARIGVRCAVRDRVPVLGNAPDFAQQLTQYQNLYNLRRRQQPIEMAKNFDNLFVIGALGSRGLTSAPLLAETLTSLMYHEPLPLSEDILQNLAPNRSWMRKLLKGSKVENLIKVKKAP